MDLVPSTITTWREWRDAYPDTEVLLPPPESSTVRGRDATRNYERDPYAGYDTADQVGIGRSEYDERLHPKTLVVGISDRGVARAYPLSEVRSAGVVNDTVGDLPVVVTDDAGGNLVAYVRTVDDETLTFEADTDETIRGGGSAWRRSTGRAVDGPHEGTKLDRANDRSPMFWFSWADVHPETEIFEAETGRDPGFRPDGGVRTGGRPRGAWWPARLRSAWGNGLHEPTSGDRRRTGAHYRALRLPVRRDGDGREGPPRR